MPGRSMKDLDVDRTLLQEVTNQNLSFSDMIKLLRRLWVLDIDSVFDVIIQDSEIIPSILLLKAGVWEENKAIFEALKKNVRWWEAHFVERQSDGVYVFRH